MALVVGFDLDMTLVDSAEGIIGTYVEAGRELGVDIDPEAVRGLIGPPLEHTALEFVPPDMVPELVRRYRAHYPAIGVAGSTLMPGAAEAVAAVHRGGGRVLVISAKIQAAVQQVLDHVGLAPDVVIGGRYAEAKGDALREHGADAYVGDHPADMVGARAASAVAVGVATGSHDRSALRIAGADVVLSDLLTFPSWLEDHLIPRR